MISSTLGNHFRPKKWLKLLQKKSLFQNYHLYFHVKGEQALANIYACIELGVYVIYTSIAGSGGFLYTHSASVNLGTEDVLFMLHGMGIENGVELEKLTLRTAIRLRTFDELLGHREFVMTKLFRSA